MFSRFANRAAQSATRSRTTFKIARRDMHHSARANGAKRVSTFRNSNSTTTTAAAAAALLLAGSVSMYLMKRALLQDPALVMSAAEAQQQQQEYSAEEVKLHNNETNGYWVIYQNDVYDITDFIDDHPGGDRIILAAGRDVHPFWNVIIHSEEARKILENHKIGTLRKEDRVVEPSEITAPIKQVVPPEGGFDSLKRVHDECSVHMQSHQELLFERNIPRALEELQTYVDMLKVHMHEEELFLIPVYRKNATHLPEREKNNHADVYVMEHNRMKAFLAQALNMMRKLKSKHDKDGKDSITTDEIIQVMDIIARHKELLNRHDNREYVDMYIGAENGTTVEERRAIWHDIFQYRHDNRFIIGDISTLAPAKIEIVAQNWNTIRDDFARQFEKKLKASERKKKTYLGPNPFSESGKPGDLATDWISGIIEKAERREFDVVARDDAKAWLHKQRGAEGQSEAEDQAKRDELITVLLDTIEDSQETFLPDAVREAWANLLNVYLSRGATVADPLEKSFPADRD